MDIANFLQLLVQLYDIVLNPRKFLSFWDLKYCILHNL